MKEPKKILVLCTANVCRSPIAEGFLKKYLTKEEGFEIVSAGVYSEADLAPSPESITVMKEEGIDISSYLSKKFPKDFAKEADLILVMSESHKDYVIRKLPEAKDKVYLYTEFAGTDADMMDIIDPIGQPVNVYRLVKEQIKMATVKIVKKIKGESNQ
jgi:protein-tyrosine-phosphatase